MAEQAVERSPWVLFRLNNQILAIPTDKTREMITIPEVTPIPRAPEFVRGVINLRGSVIALLDLRIKLNHKSMAQELEELIGELNKRRDEHTNWIDTLEKTIQDGEPFTLARDPHQCTFGKWYDNYKTDNTRLSAVLAEFDQPHKGIHASADLVDDLLRKGEKQKAEDLVSRLRTTHYAKMVDVFDDAIHALKTMSQEIAIVVEEDGTLLALAVDGVEAVEPMLDNSMENLPGNMDNGYIITMMGRRSSNKEPVLIPDLRRIISDSLPVVNEVTE